MLFRLGGACHGDFAFGVERLALPPGHRKIGLSQVWPKTSVVKSVLKYLPPGAQGKLW